MTDRRWMLIPKYRTLVEGPGRCIVGGMLALRRQKQIWVWQRSALRVIIMVGRHLEARTGKEHYVSRCSQARPTPSPSQADFKFLLYNEKIHLCCIYRWVCTKCEWCPRSLRRVPLDPYVLGLSNSLCLGAGHTLASCISTELWLHPWLSKRYKLNTWRVTFITVNN